jgi:hypothetical protein
MNISDENFDIANELRGLIQSRTETVSDGEGVAMVLLWTFLLDHARYHEMDVANLAREQLEAFIKYAADNIQLVRQH